MEDRLEEIATVPWSLPVGHELPERSKRSALPRVPGFPPRLRREVARGVETALEHHVDVVAVDQRRLVVSEQLTSILVDLLGHKGVIDHVHQVLIEMLANGGDIRRVLSVPGPLRPLLREEAACRQQQAECRGKTSGHYNPNA